MVAILTGVIAGLAHVFTGPDHLAAVAPLAVDSRRKAWSAGLRWGLGHSGGVFLVGLSLVFLRDLLPHRLLFSWSEKMVGVVLIGIGIWGLRAAFHKRLHVHEHVHEGRGHAHIHLHGSHTRHDSDEARPHVHTHTAMAVGVLHGLAGGSHVLGVLPALAFASRGDSIRYLGAFGVGTILAMVTFAAAVGMVSRGLATKGMRGYRTMMYACSVAAIAVGIYWLLAACGVGSGAATVLLRHIGQARPS